MDYIRTGGMFSQTLGVIMLNLNNVTPSRGKSSQKLGIVMGLGDAVVEVVV